MKGRLLEKCGTLIPNPDYQVIDKEGALYFENRETRGLVRTDQIGRGIFDNLPGNVDQVQEQLRKRGIEASGFLLRHFMHVLSQAGIIRRQVGVNPLGLKPKRVEGTYRISCVIVTYNSMRYIGANLESLFNQTISPFEVIVSDNGSSDETLAFIRQHYPMVRLVENNRNLHYTGAVNAGARRASGDMILILNDDVVMEPDFCEQLLRRFEADANPADVAGLTPQIRLNQTRGFLNGIGNVVRNHGWGADNYFGVVDVGQFDKMESTASACFAAVLIRKAAWDAVGEMDERFQFYDDVDWSFRAHMLGLRWLVAPKAVVYHEFGGTYPAGKKITLVVKSRQRFVLKNFSGRIMLGFFRNYLKEDWCNVVHSIRTRRPTFLRYISAYMKLIWEFPGVLWYKVTHRRPRKTDIIEFDRQSPPLVVFADEANKPLLSADVVRSYYYYLGLEE